jgi:hypothetical protein
MTEDGWLKMAKKYKIYGVKCKRREGASLLFSEHDRQSLRKHDNGTAQP